MTSESTLGEQIKYYRRLNDVKQTDLGVNLNFERSTLNHLENREMKLVNVNSIDELRFNLTEELNNTMIELLITQQMLNENKLSKRGRKLLEHHKAELLEQFRFEFQMIAKSITF